MKIYLLLPLFFLGRASFAQTDSLPNVFIITTDGFRWQEIFTGADSVILNDHRYVRDTALLRELYWNEDTEQRRRLLMPFTWNSIARNGSLYGNRHYHNKVSTANPYRFSYAGYNEILTGYADPSIIANKKRWNSNTNLLEFLDEQTGYTGKVAAFASWNLFDYILNKRSSSVFMNSGYRDIETDSLSGNSLIVNGVQQIISTREEPTRNDMLTYVAAEDYIKTHHPKVVFLGFGETDEHAHSGRYDDYLQSAHLFDEFLARLWYLVQKDPFYRNRTHFIITTDHGRGGKPASWSKHSMFVPGSDNTWLLTLGPGLEAKGEVKSADLLFNDQLAKTIAGLLGFQFTTNQQANDPIWLARKQE